MKNVSIGAKAFVVSALILAGLMVAAGILTRVVPAGTYERIEGPSGPTLVPGSYRVTERPDYPAWRWLTAPAEVLGSPDALTALVIIAFIAVAGGSFAGLNEARVLEAAVAVLARRYRTRRFRLLAAVSLFGMLLGSLMGVFEESVLLVPVAAALAASFGWDVLTGLGMSVLAVGFGFSAAVSNPFSIGTAQRLAGIPMFSGAPFRILVLAACYGLYVLFLTRHARRVERRAAAASPEDAGSSISAGAVPGAAADPDLSPESYRGARAFGYSMATLLAVVLAAALVPGLSDYSLPIMALAFLAAGFVSSRAAGLPLARWFRAFGGGALGVLPAGVLILMALSVKRIVMAGGVLDTILFGAAEAVSGASGYGAAAAMYLLTLGLNFFIGSASAKAFLLMPLLAPLADLTDISRQIAVQAFAFGDGFSNMLYPTNAVLLIALSIAGVSWTKYAKWVLPLQAAAFVLTMGLLMLSVAFGYG
ncbi:MAG TPA: AbgT family transporter [Spirochaetia bacterium]|nr:AbgT family transporter [Spirochaetia bacterium]HRZ88701.1 AbgT family transporter [Spirochaetia bacterium]